MFRALLSRIIVISFAILLGYIIPDHNPSSDVEKFTFNQSNTLLTLLSYFIKWDSAYYTETMMEGHYLYEKQLVFYPFFPLLTILTHNTLIPYCQNQLTIILTALLLNILCFMISSYYLYKITTDLNLCHVSVILALFCYNPSSIFYTTLYSESVYTMLAYISLYYIPYIVTYNHTGMPSHIYICRRSFLFVSFTLFLASFTRSNSILHIIIILICILLPYILHLYNNNKNIARVDFWREVLIIGGIVYVLCSAIVWPHFYWHIYSKHVLYYTSYMQNETCNDNTSHNTSCLCIYNIHINQYSFPFHTVYSYLQYKYWNIHLFAQYTDYKQLPNLLIASPAIILCIYIINIYSQAIWYKVKKGHNYDLHTHRYSIRDDIFVYTNTIYRRSYQYTFIQHSNDHNYDPYLPYIPTQRIIYTLALVVHLTATLLTLLAYAHFQTVSMCI